MTHNCMVEKNYPGGSKLDIDGHSGMPVDLVNLPNERKIVITKYER